MKNVFMLLISLLLLVVLMACNNDSQESERIEEVNQVIKQKSTEEVDSTIIAHDKEQNTLPAFERIAAPSISLVSSSGVVISTSFDHSYEEVCWNDCGELYHYNYPAIHGGDVEAGNQLLIDWRTLNPQPTVIYFIRVDNRDENNFKELSREEMTSENGSLKIAIDEEKVGNQYALEFIWKEGASVIGKSIMNFKLE